MNLLKAEGQLYKFTRNIQCEFQVPLALAAAGGSTQVEPRAQYMWPRLNTANEALVVGGFYTPEDAQDLGNIMPYVFGNTWYTTVVDEIYRTGWNIAYKARYQCTNMSNSTTKYDMLVFRVIRDTSNSAATLINSSPINPLNIVGQQLKAGIDRSAADDGDAKSSALHTERIQIEKEPSWRHYHKLLMKKSFMLGPGETKTHFIGRRSRFVKLIDYYPDAIVGQASIPAMLMWRRRGDKFIMYKMYSMPADVNDATVGLTADSTRTVPVSLLSYQVNYFINKPAIRPASAFIALPSSGFKAIPVAADIAIMGDDDVKEVAMRNVD